MRSKVLRFVALLPIGAVGVLGQNVTVPAVMDGVEGGGGTNIPFGSNLACRYQCIYDAAELPWVGPRVLTGIALRPDFNGGNATPAKGYLDISVLMSTTSRNSATASAVFEDNRGSDATWVLQNQLIQLPAQPQLLPPATGPRPANIAFAFQVPWAYGLTPVVTGQPAPENLLVEIWIHSQPSGAYRVDNLSSCTAPMTTFGLAGPACAHPGNAPVTLGGSTSLQAGSSYSWTVDDAPPSMPFLLALNLTNTGGLFGNPAWPLPYPMFDPANPSLPSPALAPLVWPAPDCWLNIDPAVALGGLCDAAGHGVATGVLPPGRQFVGQTLHAQAIVLAPTANPLRIITSLGLGTTVCGPLGVARVYAFYNAAAIPPAPAPTSGTLQYGVGLIFDVM